jgi:hypothetical protein
MVRQGTVEQAVHQSSSSPATHVWYKIGRQKSRELEADMMGQRLLRMGLLCASVLCAPSTVFAQAHDAHKGHGGSPAAKPAATAAKSGQLATVTDPSKLTDASKEYEGASQRMHKDMSAGYTNDVDVDFVRGMIPHHQGAIDQAQILLKYSKNPRLRRLAGGIIAAQRREIAFMMKWLEAREKGGAEIEMPDWLKNTPSPETVKTPSVPKAN